MEIPTIESNKFKIKECKLKCRFHRFVRSTSKYWEKADSTLILGRVGLSPEFFDEDACKKHGWHLQVQLLNKQDKQLMPVNFCPTCGEKIEIEEVTNIVEK